MVCLDEFWGLLVVLCCMRLPGPRYSSDGMLSPTSQLVGQGLSVIWGVMKSAGSEVPRRSGRRLILSNTRTLARPSWVALATSKTMQHVCFLFLRVAIAVAGQLVPDLANQQGSRFVFARLAVFVFGS